MATINIKFPLTDDVEKGRLFGMTEITKDQISSKLTYLLLTNKGERYYDPNYGTNLLKYVFEPNDQVTENDIENELREDVKKYMPEVTIQRVTFSEGVNDDNSVNENTLLVEISFVYSENEYSENGLLQFNF